jgi:serine/threonine-protein kinase
VREPLDPDTWRRVEAVLDKALDREPGDRAAFLDATCGDDAALRARVERLLTADAEAGDFLERSADDFAATLIGAAEGAAPVDDALPPGTMIPPYRILEQIGRGGMGAVYLAERADGQFEQRVALKLIRPGMDTGAVRARFLQERQILAGLQHRNIARLLDGGLAPDGRPFFALEHVDGRPITTFADEERLTVDERIDLFVRVCAAVAYAQRHLVVHRDIKPSNVLVTAERDVKLLDFGIAKIFAEDSDAEAGLTRDGARMLTPEYAAPEQLRGEPVTTATDVYALGCVLYELLSGHHPFAAAGALPGDLERAILRGESRRLPQAAAGEGEAARRRRTTPAALRRRLSGDLANIVEMALATGPERRYATAEALREDLERHRSGRPVAARPSSLGYRARKYLARNRMGVAAAAAVVVALAAGLVATTWQARRAEREAARAFQARDFLASLFQAADPDLARGREVTAKDILDEGARRIESELAGTPELQAEMLCTIGETYGKLGEYQESERLFRKATAVRAGLFGPADPRTTDAEVAIGDALYRQSRFAEADSLFARVVQLRRGQGDAGALATAMMNLAATKNALDDKEAAEPLYLEAIGLDRAAHGDRHPEVARDLNNYGLFLSELGRYDESRENLRAALEIARESGEEATLLAMVLSNLGGVLADQGEYKGAEAALREAIELRRTLYRGHHPSLAISLRKLATLRQQQDDLAGAQELLEQALEMSRASLGPVSDDVARCLNDLAILAFHRRDLAAARDRFAEALAVFEQVLPAGHATLVTMANNLATVALELGDVDGAEASYARVMEMRLAKLGPDHPGVASAWTAIASVHNRRARWGESLAAYREALRVYRLVHRGDGHSDIAVVQAYMTLPLRELGRLDEAEASAREALAFAARELGETHRVTASAQVELGLVLVRTGRAAEALALAEASEATRLASHDELDYRTAESRGLRGECLAALGRGAEARPALEFAVATLAELRPHVDTRRMKAALAALE